MVLKEINLIELKEKFKRKAFQQWQKRFQLAALTERSPIGKKQKYPISLQEYLTNKNNQFTLPSKAVLTTQADTKINNNF